jgi:hypothetical protein
MKVGLNFSIDVTKLDKERFVKGKKGTYANLTTFVDIDNVDQYDNNGFISQSISKEERTNGVQLPILGNVRVIYKDGQGSAPSKQQELEEDVPF